MEQTRDLFLTTILVPVLLLTLRTLLGQEINYWFTLIGCYMRRPFDVDNNPDTHDWAMIFNESSGDWECCSLTFHFGIWKGENGAFVHHYTENWEPIFTERIPFTKWKATRKGKIRDTSKIPGLREKINGLPQPVIRTIST